MSNDVPNGLDNVWYVGLGALSCMTNHGEWFKSMHDPKKPRFVEIGDNKKHSIAHIGDVPLNVNDGKVKYLANVLHVPKITKNLVSVGQMVEHGLQVQFNCDGCFVEELYNKCRLVARGKRMGKMFTLDVNVLEVKAAIFVHGAGVIADVDIWHKWIGHLNL